MDGSTVVLGSQDPSGAPGRGWRCRTLTVTLNATIPWDIQFLQAAADRYTLTITGAARAVTVSIVE